MKLDMMEFWNINQSHRFVHPVKVLISTTHHVGREPADRCMLGFFQGTAGEPGPWSLSNRPLSWKGVRGHAAPPMRCSVLVRDAPPPAKGVILAHKLPCIGWGELWETDVLFIAAERNSHTLSRWTRDKRASRRFLDFTCCRWDKTPPAAVRMGVATPRVTKLYRCGFMLFTSIWPKKT